MVLEVDGDVHYVEAGLVTDETSWGRRWWLECLRCGSRRRYLHLVNGDLICRSCAGLKYEEQCWPASRWREIIGRPALRAWRRLKKAA